MSNSISKVKGLGSIPILGALFRSKNFENNKTELVIFITPTVIDAHSEINRQEASRVTRMLDDFKQGIKKRKIILD